MKRRYVIGLLGAAALLLSCLAVWLAPANCSDTQPAAADRRGSFEFQGRTREYVLHLPPSSSDAKPLPLVIAMHGGGGNAENQIKTTGMNDKADHAGFVVVYPQGITRFRTRLRTWNAGNCCGYALTEHVDDVAFMRALLARLKNEIKYDPSRVYATGLSNGGMMAYRLACEMADQIAAIAPVAGALNLPDCRPSKTVSVMIFHGTADQHVLYGGGRSSRQADWLHPRTDRSVADAEAFWVKHDQCTQPPTTKTEGRITWKSYANCAEGSEVVVITIQGGGHAWPGGRAAWPGGDEPTHEISANDAMWDFFARHHR
jgi:polyhydroxybutyrate depolymerase